MALVYPIIFVIASSEWIIFWCNHQTRSLLNLYFRLLYLSVFSINHATVTVCSVCISLMTTRDTSISYCPDNKTWTLPLYWPLYYLLGQGSVNIQLGAGLHMMIASYWNIDVQFIVQICSLFFEFLSSWLHECLVCCLPRTTIKIIPLPNNFIYDCILVMPCIFGLL